MSYRAAVKPSRSVTSDRIPCTVVDGPTVTLVLQGPFGLVYFAATTTGAVWVGCQQLLALMHTVRETKWQLTLLAVHMYLMQLLVLSAQLLQK